MNMQVKVVKLFPDSETVKAVANVVFDNNFVVHGIKVIDSDKGLFVAMPNVKTGEKRKDIFHPINQEARKMLCDAILAAYEVSIANPQELSTAEEQQKANPARNLNQLKTKIKKEVLL